MRYEFTSKHGGSYFFHESDRIVLDLNKYGELSDRDKDYLIEEILMHEHLHRILYREFGENTEKLLDCVYHKYYKRENDMYEEIVKKNHAKYRFWSESVKERYWRKEFRRLRKEAGREHGGI